MSKGGRYAQHKPRKRPMGGGMIVLIVVAVILILAVAGLIGGLVYKTMMDRATVQISTVPSVVTEVTEVTTEATTEPTTEPTTVPTTLPYKESGKDIINILVIGQSARAGEAAEDYRLADTMILATVNKTKKTLTLTSFLRDTYVQLPAFKRPSGKSRINVCYHLGYLWGDVGGAMQKTNECLKTNFGIEVDYDVEVDFEGFIKIVDMLDGVEMELTEAEADYLNKDKLYVYYEVEPGLQRLDGMAALSYARMRKANGDGDSDIKRTGRQRELITAILNKLKTRSFSQLQELANAALPMVTTNMTNDEIITCMWEILPILGDLTIETGTCPVKSTYWSKEIQMGDYPAYVLDFDKGQNTKLMQAITEGIEIEEPKETTKTK